MSVDRKTHEAKARDLFAQGLNWNQIVRELTRQLGKDAKTSKTYRTWYAANQAEWDAARDALAVVNDGELSVEADLARLRNVRRRSNQLAAKDTLSPAEVGEAKLLLQFEEKLEKRLDPDQLLIWFERFAPFAADDPDPKLAERMIAKADDFVKKQFALVKFATQASKK